jgi:hypothetical protein
MTSTTDGGEGEALREKLSDRMFRRTEDAQESEQTSSLLAVVKAPDGAGPLRCTSSAPSLGEFRRFFRSRGGQRNGADPPHFGDSTCRPQAAARGVQPLDTPLSETRQIWLFPACCHFHCHPAAY